MRQRLFPFFLCFFTLMFVFLSCENDETGNDDETINDTTEIENSIRYPDTLIAFLPAPGQYVNASPGLKNNAESIIGGSGLVSLGGYGGYIIVGFNQPIINDTAHQYGVDFTIVGNAFDGSSEPGIVMVMEDKNHNGLADETWYELQGEDHLYKSTISDYEITYYYINDTTITWKDNQGDSDTLLHNIYHTQSYYPSTENYPLSNNDSITFRGTKLPSQQYYDESGSQWVNPNYGYGYADNLPVNNSVAFNKPDNPYTDDTEGCGADAFDIDWAVDSNRQSVSLDSIYFVKIYCGVLDANSVIGEVSTEIRAIVPVD